MIKPFILLIRSLNQIDASRALPLGETDSTSCNLTLSCPFTDRIG